MTKGKGAHILKVRKVLANKRLDYLTCNHLFDEANDRVDWESWRSFAFFVIMLMIVMRNLPCSIEGETSHLNEQCKECDYESQQQKDL